MPSSRRGFRGDGRGATLDGWCAEAAPELDAASIGAHVANPHEEGATAAVVDDAGVVGVPFAAQPNRAADHAQGEVVVDRESASSSAAAAPGRQAALAHGRPAGRLGHQGPSADHDHGQPGAHRHPVRKPALLDLNDQPNTLVAIQKKGIGPRAVGQARVDQHFADGRVQRLPRFFTAGLALAKDLGCRRSTGQPRSNHVSERTFGGRHGQRRSHHATAGRRGCDSCVTKVLRDFP